MDINEAEARVNLLGDKLELARSDVASRQQALETAEEEESRMNTLYLAAEAKFDAAIRAASEKPANQA